MNNTPLNIVLLISHDTGRYIAPYGHPVPTPHLQALAEDGVTFRHAFCAGPTCAPARSALYTGTMPHVNGQLGLGHLGWRPHDYSWHMAHHLAAQGYQCATAGAGNDHLANVEGDEAYRHLGYHEHVHPWPHVGAAQFLDRRPQEPFFLNVGFSATHRDFQASKGKPLDGRWIKPPDPLPDTARIREDMAAFHLDAASLDAAIGEIVAAVERNGLRERTLIIATTDHGIPFPGCKCTLTAQGLGVFLIMRGPREPGGFCGGLVHDALVSHMDLFPSICELAGIPTPERCAGQSLLPLIRGEVAAVHEQLFGEVTYHASYEPMRSVRDQRFSYIRRFDDRRRPVLPHIDPSPSKEEWLAHGYGEQPPEPERLHDLMLDPHEQRNLIHDPRYAEEAQGLRALLQDWMQETDDPILKGPVPLRDGARLLADPDARGY